MSYTFNDTELPRFEVLPKGDVQFEVISLERTISKGGKTTGCSQINLTLKINRPDAEGFADTTFTLPDEHTEAKTANFLRGKFDQFLKSSGAVAQKGDSVDVENDAFFLGLRGWAHNEPREYDKRDGGKGQVNDIKYFITDKGRLPRASKAAAAMPTNEEMAVKKSEWE